MASIRDAYNSTKKINDDAEKINKAIADIDNCKIVAQKALASLSTVEGAYLSDADTLSDISNIRDSFSWIDQNKL